MSTGVVQGFAPAAIAADCTYVIEAGSTLALTTLALVVTLPIGLYLIGAK